MSSPEESRQQRLIALGFPLLGVRDISTHWRPIKTNSARLRNPSTAIFPQTWKPYPNNPLLLYNPVEFACRADPLRGCFIPKKHSWMLTTRYGGLEAFKWRKWELVKQEDYRVAKEEADAHHGYTHVSGPYYPKPRLVIQPTTFSLLSSGEPVQDRRPAIRAESESTGFAIGDAILARQRQRSGASDFTSSSSRKRKAESSEPDLVVPVSNHASSRTVQNYARPAPRPRDSTSRFRAVAFRPMSWTRSIMTYFRGTISSVTSCLYELVNRRSSAVEQRVLDPQTGNVVSKRRRVSRDEDTEPAWIDEEARDRLWNLHFKRLYQGLSQVKISIKDQHAGNSTNKTVRESSHRASSFAHLKLENFVTLVLPITHAASIIEHLYSRRVLERAKHYNKKPQAQVRYDLESEDDKLSIELAIRLLSNFPPDLRPILNVWRIEGSMLRTVCDDLKALLEKRPIPSLVVNGSPEIFARWERAVHVAEDADIIMADVPDNTEYEQALAIPGSFPEEENDDEAGQKPELHDPEPDVSQSVARSKNRDPMDDTLPTVHETIPFDLIQAHLVDPVRADTYIESSKRPMRSILKDKLKISSSPSPKRLQQAIHMKKSVHFPVAQTPRTRYGNRQHALDHPIYWPPSSVSPSSTSPTSRASTKRSPRSPTQRIKAARVIRRTSAAFRAVTMLGSPSASRHDAGRYYVSAGGRDADHIVDPDHVAENPDTVRKSPDNSNVYHASTNDEDIAATPDVELPLSPDLTDKDRNMPQSATSSSDGALHIPGDEPGEQKEPDDDANESQEERDQDVLSRHRHSINGHMQEGLSKYYTNSPQPPEAGLDDKLSGLQISDDVQSRLDDITLRRQVEEEERKAAAEAAAKAEADAEKKRADEEKLRKTGGLRAPRSKMVAPLSEEWSLKVKASITRQGAAVARTFEGTELTPRDFAKVVPPTEWLNDEIINGTLLWLDRFVNLAAGISETRSADRKCLALSSFIWKRIQDAGPGSTGRALRRFGVSKANFGELDTVLLPVCEASHWTLIVVRPKMRTIAHMDSLNPAGSPNKIRLAHAWVKATLEEKFVEDEWKVVRHEAPRQTNGYDCGVHTITNAMCIALGLNPIDAYASNEMPLQRLRIAAMLLNEGFSNDFDLGGL